ncbi:DUF2795 domain-containing protein [Yinghuangia sp. YIM S09857]|uniref:DUF2795 domain-containing protein n=1 Tax=Yinghuangia sp. YIM S09857 TaxID=3436929 RepID=UPI003F531878
MTARAIHHALAGARYPARPADLAAHARNRGAAPHLVAALAALPDRPICGPNQVSAAIAGPHAKNHPGP